MIDKKEPSFKELIDEMQQNKKVLQDIARWLRFQNIGKLKEVLVSELDTDEKKLAFENSDGENGLKELSTLSGAPQDTIYGWWKKWFNLGIVEPSEKYKGRLRKICSLDDVGLKIPKAKSAKKDTSQDNKTTEQSKPSEGSDKP